MKVEVHHYILSISQPPLKTAKIDEVEVQDSELEKYSPDVRLYHGVRPILMMMGYRVRFFTTVEGIVHAIVGDIRPEHAAEAKAHMPDPVFASVLVGSVPVTVPVFENNPNRNSHAFPEENRV